ncbi:hypothetical protein GGX14DRAFT_387548 [Mycena pura]|uniref:WD40 repeat-like protein n=1 Tax=Mycena pura TaxID=153505 RepID=A0AAD6YLR2_9AGAR|nr:hypothetical protein GGX14DRAFT_387548 [Mycena pura]
MANQYSAPSTSFGLPQTLRLPEEQKHINVITFSEDGTFLAVATGGDSNSGCLTIWEVSERVSRLRQAQSIGFNSPVRAAAWCGGSAISVGLANGQIWDISSATGNISEDTEPIFRMTAPIHNIAYDSASKRVLVGSGRQVILANWPTLWIKSNAIESTTVDDVPVEVKFHSTSGSCFITWLKEGVQVYAHGVNDNHEVFLDKLWSFTYTGLSSGISLSENHLVVKTLFNGLLWFDIETHDLIHTSPGWALGPAPEQQLTPFNFWEPTKLPLAPIRARF